MYKPPAVASFIAINKVELYEREWGELYDGLDLRVYVVY